MAILFRRFRDWWQPPRRAGDRIEHRQVTFLELFYDLVYVVIIAELSHALSAHLSWQALGEFAFMFVVVWWAWLNGTTYVDLHGQNDIRTRVFTFLQMLTVVAMAIFAHDALGETSVGFAYSYATFQLTLLYLWWRTGVYDPNHRPLSRPYSFAFLVTTVLFVISTFVPVEIRFYLWGAAVFISLLLPLFTFGMGRNNPIAQAEIEIVTNVTPSLVERFGLFNIIVLGEIIVGVVAGVTDHHHLSWEIGKIALLGTLMGIMIWWLYFDSVSHRLPKRPLLSVMSWFYLHLPLTMGITAVGASILSIITHIGDHQPVETQLMFSISLAVVLASIAGLIQTIQTTDEHRNMHIVGGRAALIAAILAGIMGFIELEITWILIILLILVIGPILIAFLAWLRTLDEPSK
jgi:low temperature requirement protein LtrA